MDRVPKEMRPILDDPKVLFDIHCHVFSYKDVPNRFIGMRIPMNRRALAKIEHFLHKILGHTDTDWFSRRANFLHLLQTCSPWEISQKLANYYPNRKAIMAPLTLDMETGIKGKVKHSFEDQIEWTKELRDQKPDALLPFLCVDPNHPRVKQNFLKAFSTEDSYQFFGVKVYPSLGYLPSHPVLMEIFRICEEKNIPVTAHCGGARVHTSRKFIKQIPGLHKDASGTWRYQEKNRLFLRKKAYSTFFNDPKNWEPVLEKYPSLKLNLAHFGGTKDWKKFCKGNHNNRVSYILDMMNRYEYVYADFSYTFHVQTYNLRLKQMLEQNKLLAKRLLFGSDFYMIVLEGDYRLILADFITIMGDRLMEKISVENPKQFLFEQVSIPSRLGV